MPTLEGKAKELIEHLDLLMHRFLLFQQESTDQFDNLTRQEFRVIVYLGKRGPGKMSEIAEQVMLAISSTTALVDSLVKKKLVQRARNEEDRRVVNVELTSQGKAIYRMAYEKRLKMGRGILSSLEIAEQDALLGLFRKVTEKIRNQDGLKRV